VQFTTLQVASDATFLNVLVNQSWWGVVTTHSHPFDRDHAALYWRVLLSRQNAPIISSTPTRFNLDATAAGNRPSSRLSSSCPARPAIASPGWATTPRRALTASTSTCARLAGRGRAG
jgi:hypothetical protein